MKEIFILIVLLLSIFSNCAMVIMVVQGELTSYQMYMYSILVSSAILILYGIDAKE